MIVLHKDADYLCAIGSPRPASVLGEYVRVTSGMGSADGPKADETDGDTRKARDTAVSERRFRFLVAGYAVSSYGTFLNMVALNLFVYETTGRALAMGLFMAVRLASGFVAGLVVGGLLARFSAKSIMLWANVGQGAVMLVLILAPDGMLTGALMAVSVVIGACGTLFMVALRSSIPEMVGEDRRAWANSSRSPAVRWPWWRGSPRRAWWCPSSGTPPPSLSIWRRSWPVR